MLDVEGRVFAEAELLWNDLVAEIALADEERHDEHARSGKAREDAFDGRFLFPERLAHFGEKFPATQFCRVLIDRRGGTGILLGAVPQHHQRGIAEFIAFHAKGLAQDRPLRKLALQKPTFWLKPFAFLTILSFNCLQNKRNNEKSNLD